MGHNYNWYDAKNHRTLAKGDVIKITGTVYSKATGTKKTTLTRASKYFYSYYTSTSSTVIAPICYCNTKGTPYAYVKTDAVIEGGTLDTYKISYNANGGSNAPSSQTKTHGKTLTLTTSRPTRANHNFVGWNLNKTLQTESGFYASGASFKIDADTTLYAVWNPYTHTVKYDANGGKNAPESITKTYNVAYYISSTIPTREGYTFLGWSTTKTATTPEYKSGEKYTHNQNGGTVTLYAVWEETTYDIYYSANGGENAPSTQTKKYNVDIKLSTKEPTREGYTFLGWSLLPDDTTVIYKAGATYSSNADAYLFAVWNRDTYQIDYIIEDEVVGSVKYVCGATAKLSPYETMKYTFVAWRLNSLDGQAVTTVTSNTKDEVIKLYGQVVLKTYTVSIYPREGTYEGSDSVVVKKVTYGESITLSDVECSTGTFRGWTVSGNATLQGKTLTVYGKTEVYAIIQSKELRVYYNARGGKFEDGSSLLTVGYNIGDDLREYESPTPTRTGYDFLGWYDTYDNKVNVPYESFIVTENLMLNAKWKKSNSSYVHDENTFKEGTPYVCKDNKMQEGYIYVFKNGTFMLGTIKRREES